MKRLVVLGVIAITSISGLFGTSPALAHDEILGTTPAANSSVEAGVIDVSVAFNEDIMNTPDNVGEVIQVDGPSGADSATWSNDCVAVAGPKASTQVDLDQPGKYTVTWRSVSNDGHANEGTFDFTLTNTTGHQSTGLVAPTPACAARIATPVLISAPINTDRGVATIDNEGNAALPIAVGTIGVVAVLIVAFWVVRRRRARG